MNPWQTEIAWGANGFYMAHLSITHSDPNSIAPCECRVNHGWLSCGLPPQHCCAGGQSAKQEASALWKAHCFHTVVRWTSPSLWCSAGVCQYPRGISLHSIRYWNLCMLKSPKCLVFVCKLWSSPICFNSARGPYNTQYSVSGYK